MLEEESEVLILMNDCENAQYKHVIFLVVSSIAGFCSSGWRFSRPCDPWPWCVDRKHFITSGNDIRSASATVCVLICPYGNLTSDLTLGPLGNLTLTPSPNFGPGAACRSSYRFDLSVYTFWFACWASANVGFATFGIWSRSLNLVEYLIQSIFE